MSMTAAPASTATRIVNLTDDWDRLQSEWDRYVEEHPKGSVFHSSSMIRVFAAAKLHRVLPLAAIDADGAIVALLAAVCVQTLPDPLGRVSSRSIWYAEPLCDDNPASIDALASLIEGHDQLVRRRALFTEVRPLFAPGPERIAIERCGYVFYEYLNFLVDLTAGSERLWENLRKSCRRSIRSGRERGFTVRELDPSAGAKPWYGMLRQTYQHAKVPLAHRSLFEAAIEQLCPGGRLRCFGVFDGDQLVAVDSLLPFKKRLFAWYGGSERMVGASPFDLLQWHEFEWGSAEGYSIFDFGGAGRPDEPYGVRDFKAKFGGELVNFGRYRRVHSPWKLAVAERAYRIGRTIISPK